MTDNHPAATAMFLFDRTWKETTTQQVPAVQDLGVHCGLGQPVGPDDDPGSDEICESVTASLDGLRIHVCNRIINPGASMPPDPEVG